jgi:hypothetical protein
MPGTNVEVAIKKEIGCPGRRRATRAKSRNIRKFEVTRPVDQNVRNKRQKTI